MTIENNSRLKTMQRLRRSSGLIDVHAHLGVDVVNFYNGDFPYAIAAEDHGVRMACHELAASVVFPFIYTEFYDLTGCRQGQFRRNRRAQSVAPYEFENRRLCQEIYEAFPEYAGKLLPFGCFDPGRHQAAQVACLQQLLGQYPIYGLKTATSYLHSHITDLLRAGSVLLDFAAEHDLPVTMHTAIIEGDPWANVHQVLKVAQARPDVRFIIAHACRFERRALELAASLPNAFVDCAALHIHCLLAQQNHAAVAARCDRFAADYRSPAAVLHKLAQAYPETVVWGSDTPAHYWKSRFCDAKGEVAWLNLPCGPYDEATTLKKLPDAVQVKIARQNTLRALFGSVAHTRRRVATTKRNSQVQHLQTTSDKRRP